MKITNNHGLPQTIVNAIERDDYTMGAARMSVTGLLKPPRIGLLYAKHHDKIERDVTDMIWSLFGRAVHKILEQGGDEQHIPEERLFAEVRGWIISGQLDLQMLGPKKVKITDYKTTSAYAVMHEKTDWLQQLNTYRWLLETATDHRVQELAVCAFVRDWSRHRAKENPEYPQVPTVMIPIPMWTMAEAGAFVEERVKVHQKAIASSDMGEEPPLCTDDERWMRGASYAVVKRGGKRAAKVFDDMIQAANYAEFRGAEYDVQTRLALPVRCQGDYCGVSAWCSQYAQWKKENPDA